MWEVQIRELGGPNYMRGGGKVYDEAGNEIGGVAGKGYRYFGRARELPGVKEMFEVKRGREGEGERKGLESRGDLRMRVDAAYYGYNLDEEDGSLVAYEKGKEEEARRALVEQGEWKREEGWEALPGDGGDGVGWRLPSLEEVQDELVERRRRKLLDKLG